MQHLTTADRVHAILTDERGGEREIPQAAELLDELRPGADTLAGFEFGVLVGAAYTLERLDDPLAPHEAVLLAAEEAATEAWVRYAGADREALKRVADVPTTGEVVA